MGAAVRAGDILNSTYDVVFIVATIIGGISWVIRRLEKRLAAQDTILVKLAAKQTEMQSQLDTQFGGNGGGMREAINKQSVRLARVEGQLGVEP